jgi:hypothetical protein
MREEKSETMPALGNSSRRKKLVGKPLNEKLGDNAMYKRDGHKNRIKHLQKEYISFLVAD